MDYGRQIYNTLQDILEFMQTWKTDLETWQESFQTFFQGLFDTLFPVLCLICLLLGVSLVFRLFFPDWRN